MEKCGRTGQTTDDKMRCVSFAFWIIEATHTDTHTHTHTHRYVIFTAFPRQQRLHEHILILRYTYIVFFFYGHTCDFSYMITIGEGKNPIFGDVAWNIF